MSYEIPEEWLVESTGERLILDQEKVAAKIEKLLWGINTVLETFRKDEAEGFKSRDKTFAIDILSKALEMSGET